MVHNAHNAAALLRAGHAIDARVTSGSMAPTLVPGDEVHVDPLAAYAVPAIGSVVLIHEARNDSLIVHRLLARVPGTRPTRYVHAGDAPHAEPYLCRADQVLGVARLPRVPSSPLKVVIAAARLVLRFVQRSNR